MKHLLTLADLSIEEINAILDDAQGFCDGTLKCDLSGRIAANLFFESSKIKLNQRLEPKIRSCNSRYVILSFFIEPCYI